MGDVTNRLFSAMNAHDLDAFVSCFSEDYQSEQPAHPTRNFRGRDKVRENWARVFSGIPDFRAELVSSAVSDDGVEMGEWRWSGKYVDDSAFAMRGVTVLGIAHDRIAWGRLYMEVVEEGGASIDAMVRDTYRPISD